MTDATATGTFDPIDGSDLPVSGRLFWCELRPDLAGRDRYVPYHRRPRTNKNHQRLAMVAGVPKGDFRSYQVNGSFMG